MTESLKNYQDFKRVYDHGKSYANKYLVMYVLKEDLNITREGCPGNRLGISVSKKVGNSVVRHRITRLIREGYRLNESQFSSGLNIVVIARSGAKGKNYFEIRDALLHLASLHKILI